MAKKPLLVLRQLRIPIGTESLEELHEVLSEAVANIKDFSCIGEVTFSWKSPELAHEHAARMALLDQEIAEAEARVRVLKLNREIFNA